MTTLSHPTNALYPGMICNSTEFFVSDNETKIIQSGRILPFCEISLGTLELLKETINADLPAKLELHDMHPNSEMMRVEQFARCRFGGLDFEGDIKEGKLQDGEYWACPNRGTCKSEGILCKLPNYNNERLTTEDVQLLQLTSTNLTNDVIGEKMNMPMGSFHKAKKILYGKLNIQTKQEGVMISFLLNLIQL